MYAVLIDLRYLVTPAAFFIAVFLQTAFPLKTDRSAILQNWRTNLPLGLFGAITLWVTHLGALWEIAEWVGIKKVGLFHWIGVPALINAFLTILALDCLSYLWHRAHHRFQPLWRLHSVHHSDTVLDASSAVRFHPVEILLSFVGRMLVVAGLGLSPLGVILYEMIFTLSNFIEHGHIRLNPRLEAALEIVLVTPTFHRRHHSTTVQLQNSNFSTIFSFWDRLGRSHTSASSKAGEIGLAGFTDQTYSWTRLVRWPFTSQVPTLESPDGSSSL